MLRSVPRTVRQRIWVLYKARLPEDRFLTTRGLYLVPTIETHNRRLVKEEDRREQVTDKAKKRGALTPATQEDQ